MDINVFFKVLLIWTEVSQKEPSPMGQAEVSQKEPSLMGQGGKNWKKRKVKQG